MRIGILSDIHDNLPALRRALEVLGRTEVLLCCGDLCSPFVIDALAEGYPRDIHIVLGNNDGDAFRITSRCRRHSRLHLHGEMAELTLDDCRFCLIHYDNIARAIAPAHRHDIVCFGHNHRFEISRQGPTLLLNPGEVHGGLTGASTCASLDTRSREPTRHDL